MVAASRVTETAGARLTADGRSVVDGAVGDGRKRAPSVPGFSVGRRGGGDKRSRQAIDGSAGLVVVDGVVGGALMD